MKQSSRVIALLVAAVLSGCTSVYHASRDRLPPGLAATLTLRVEEARAAETEAQRIAALVQRAQVQDHRAVESRLDQLDVAARDFDRAVLALSDAAAVSTGDYGSELSRLETRRQQLAKSLSTARSGDWKMAANALRPWIEGSTSVAGGS